VGSLSASSSWTHHRLPVFIDSADTERSAGCQRVGAADRAADVRRSDPVQHKRQHDEHDVRPQVVTARAVASGRRRQQPAETVP